MANREFQGVDVVIKEKDKDEGYLQDQYIYVPGHFFFPASHFLSAYIKENGVLVVSIVYDPLSKKEENLYTISSKFENPNNATQTLEKIKEAIIKYRKHW